MLKRFFLSIIILSALTSESGAYYSAPLIDFYLLNLSHLDMVQDSRNVISNSDAQKSISLAQKGTPLAFFKKLSEDAANSRSAKTGRYLDFGVIFGIQFILAIFIASYILLNNEILYFTKRTLLSLADSSPPIYC